MDPAYDSILERPMLRISHVSNRFVRGRSSANTTADCVCYTLGEVTSQSLWPRKDRHFVGITGILMCVVKGRRFIVLFK